MPGHVPYVSHSWQTGLKNYILGTRGGKLLASFSVTTSEKCGYKNLGQSHRISVQLSDSHKKAIFHTI